VRIDSTKCICDDEEVIVRKALIVGIDYYVHINSLYGCANDAYSVKSVLERHLDGRLNFDIDYLIATESNSAIDRRLLKDKVIELFRDDSEVSLIYFSGHGYIESTGGFLITSECRDGDDGFSMNELLSIVNSSPAQNRIVILDSCHAGIAGTPNPDDNKAIIQEGVTILAASSAEQYAIEENGAGIFTTLLVDALNGSAANLVGDVTPGSVYAHIDQSLGAWQQRPIFKTNVKSFISLRQVEAPVRLTDLTKITELFIHANDECLLDPSFEPDSNEAAEENVEKFKILQKYNRVNLVVPVGEEHMYYAAMNSKSCKLTALGKHYWNLVTNGRI